MDKFYTLIEKAATKVMIIFYIRQKVLFVKTLFNKLLQK